MRYFPVPTAVNGNAEHNDRRRSDGHALRIFQTAKAEALLAASLAAVPKVAGFRYDRLSVHLDRLRYGGQFDGRFAAGSLGCRFFSRTALR